MSPTRHSGLRVRDADRVDACALLDTARDDGQLTADEHADRTSAALRAKTFGDIDALVRDLQIPRNLVRSPVVNPQRRRRSRRWIPAVAAVAAAAAVGALVGVAATDRPGSGSELPDLTTARGIEFFLADYRAHFGDLMVDELTLHPTHASFERGVPGGTESFTYRGQFGGSSVSKRDPSVQPFDLGAIDLPLLARYLAGAPQTLATPEGVVGHLSIQRDTDLLDDGPAITIYTEGTLGTGHMAVGPAGEVLEVFPANR
ncbi:DUF1707 SHOCT-like domain-containing protein [Nocardia wallacei]|uniref:DUF1707 SHOCT-like domain-containing protein n=1 Tax=Nocardia wallacei TaxID=480035 RepID=UPI002456D6BC|nr:DUF1707 domain-containing protein [Nocardia wallacei]